MGSKLPQNESAHLNATTVGGVLHNLIRHPYELLIRRWNWKSALMSSLFRGLIFFCTNLVAGFRAAVGALVAEFVYRALTAGFYGAMTQSFRHARPEWVASLTAMVLLPAVSHVLEFLVHWARGTPRLYRSIVASVIFTIITTLFNLYAMRRGALVVGPRRDSLAQDMRRMPRLIGGFVTVLPKAIRRLMRAMTRPNAAPRTSTDTGERTCAD